MFRRLMTLVRLMLHRNRWVQIALLTGIWLGADRLAAWSHLPIPGGVIGLAILLVLLLTGLVRQSWFRHGTASLLDHMLLFFVPAMMALLDHHELFGKAGLILLGVIVVGTVLVMAGTALAVELCFRWTLRHERS